MPASLLKEILVLLNRFMEKLNIGFGMVLYQANPLTIVTASLMENGSHPGYPISGPALC